MSSMEEKYLQHCSFMSTRICCCACVCVCGGGGGGSRRGCLVVGLCEEEPSQVECHTEPEPCWILPALMWDIVVDLKSTNYICMKTIALRCPVTFDGLAEMSPDTMQWSGHNLKKKDTANRDPSSKSAVCATCRLVSGVKLSHPNLRVLSAMPTQHLWQTQSHTIALIPALDAL